MPKPVHLSGTRSTLCSALPGAPSKSCPPPPPTHTPYVVTLQYRDNSLCVGPVHGTLTEVLSIPQGGVWGCREVTHICLAPTSAPPSAPGNLISLGILGDSDCNYTFSCEEGDYPGYPGACRSNLPAHMTPGSHLPAQTLIYEPGGYLTGILLGMLRDTPVTHMKGLTYPSCRQRSLSNWQRS